MSKNNSKDCEYKCIDKVLHIIYKSNIPSYVNNIADKYEGNIPDRIGINFPMNFVKKSFDISLIYDIKKYIDEAKYVVVYKKGDKITKEHELLHAKYYMDEKYKKSIQLIWDDMKKESKKKVISMLKKMGYDEDREDIMIDEFQAYYYTEKSNFFGKNLI